MMELELVYWHWLVLGMLLVGFEIFVPSFTVLWFGLGAVVVAVVVLSFVPVEIQLILTDLQFVLVDLKHLLQSHPVQCLVLIHRKHLHPRHLHLIDFAVWLLDLQYPDTVAVLQIPCTDPYIPDTK